MSAPPLTAAELRMQLANDFSSPPQSRSPSPFGGSAGDHNGQDCEHDDQPQDQDDNSANRDGPSQRPSSSAATGTVTTTTSARIVHATQLRQWVRGESNSKRLKLAHQTDLGLYAEPPPPKCEIIFYATQLKILELLEKASEHTQAAASTWEPSSQTQTNLHAFARITFFSPLLPAYRNKEQTAVRLVIAKRKLHDGISQLSLKM